jgi:hypothetical protein
MAAFFIAGIPSCSPLPLFSPQKSPPFAGKGRNYAPDLQEQRRYRPICGERRRGSRICQVPAWKAPSTSSPTSCWTRRGYAARRALPCRAASARSGCSSWPPALDRVMPLFSSRAEPVRAAQFWPPSTTSGSSSMLEEIRGRRDASWGAEELLGRAEEEELGQTSCRGRRRRSWAVEALGRRSCSGRRRRSWAVESLGRNRDP